jgi:hypothetical protein
LFVVLQPAPLSLMEPTSPAGFTVVLSVTFEGQVTAMSKPKASVAVLPITVLPSLI